MYIFTGHILKSFECVRSVNHSTNYSIHDFVSDKSLYYTGYINYNHRLLIVD